MRKSLSDFDLEDLEQQFQLWGFRPAQARRLIQSFYASAGKLNLDGLVLARRLKEHLAKELQIRQSWIDGHTLAADGTRKLLLRFDAGGAVEAVLMPSHRADRAAGCVSSQMGCAVGCDFCASTREGLERNLSAGEIVEQFLHLRAEAQTMNRRLVTLVFMGMGEPLHNTDSVIAAIRRISRQDMGALGGRQITVSTVGIVPEIGRLAEANLNVNLAISLHAADDATREALVPLARRWPAQRIVEAARAFAQRTGRMVTFSCCLLKDVNDTPRHAGELARLLNGFRAHVNLIPYNSTGVALSGLCYEPCDEDQVERFLRVLREQGVVAHWRRPRGTEVAAACGQLYRRRREAPPALLDAVQSDRETTM